MMKIKQNLWDLISSFLVIGYVIIFIVTLMIGCAATGGSKTNKLTAQQQKAYQDSLSKVYEFEMLKLMSFGNENLKNGEYDSALPHYWKVSKMDTINRFPMLYQSIGDCYLKLNKTDSVEVTYRLATKKYPMIPYYHRMLGWVLAAREENEEAIQEYQQAIELDSVAHAEDYRAIGNLLVKQNRIQEAVTYYKKLAELEPNNPEVLMILVKLYQSLGEKEASLDAIEQALTISPDNTQLLFNLGEEYYRQGDYENAIEKLNQLIGLNPEDVLALEILGYAYQNSGDFKKAIATYEKVLSLKPEHTKVLCEMATCYKEINNFTKAYSFVRKALDIDSDYGFAHFVLGEIFEKTADNCKNSREKKMPTFDDKLVYEMAYNEYKIAKTDLQFAKMATDRMNYIADDIPKKQDRFMHPNQRRPRGVCYKWINEKVRLSN